MSPVCVDEIPYPISLIPDPMSMSYLQLHESLTAGELPGGWGYWWLRSLYWTMKTMTTTGYGDITPRSDVELVFTILVVLYGHALFAYLFGTIATSFSQLDVSAQMFRRLLAMFQHFVSNRRLARVRKRVLDYCNFIWNETHGVD